MRLRPRSYRPVICCLLSVASILLNSRPAHNQQTPLTEWLFPTSNDPRIVISNASLVSIIAWDKSEVLVKADVLATQIQSDEVRIKSANNRLEIACSPAKADRKVFLTLRVPAKAVLSIETHGNSIQVTELADQIIISFASREMLQLTVPESSALDMKEARNAVERRQLGPLGNARIGRSWDQARPM